MRAASVLVATALAVLVAAWLLCALAPQCRTWLVAPDLADPPLSWPAASTGS